MKKAALLLLCVVLVAGGVFVLLPEADADSYGPGDPAWEEGLQRAKEHCEQIAEDWGGEGTPWEVDQIHVIDHDGEPTGDFHLGFECQVDSGIWFQEHEEFNCFWCLYEQ